jgi:predicted nucleic acid-binding protein
VVEEPESGPLDRYLAAERHLMATSRVALVEVLRAVRLANPDPDAEVEALRLLNSCLLVNVNDFILRHAARLASERLRTLDAIHLATAAHVEPDAVIVYDQRLREACVTEGLVVVAPA